MLMKLLVVIMYTVLCLLLGDVHPSLGYAFALFLALNILQAYIVSQQEKNERIKFKTVTIEELNEMINKKNDVE